MHITFTCLVIAIAVSAIRIDALLLRNQFKSYSVKGDHLTNIRSDYQPFHYANKPAKYGFEPRIEKEAIMEFIKPSDSLYTKDSYHVDSNRMFQNQVKIVSIPQMNTNDTNAYNTTKSHVNDSDQKHQPLLKNHQPETYTSKDDAYNTKLDPSNSVNMPSNDQVEINADEFKSDIDSNSIDIQRNEQLLVDRPLNLLISTDKIEEKNKTNNDTQQEISLFENPNKYYESEPAINDWIFDRFKEARAYSDNSLNDARTKNLNAKKLIPSEERYSMPSSRSSQHGFRNNFNRPYEQRAYSSPYDYRNKYEDQSKPNNHFFYEQMRYEPRRYDHRNPYQPMIPFQNAMQMPPMPYIPSRQYPPSMPFYPDMMTPFFVDHNPGLSNEMRRQAEYNREAMRQPNENNKMSEKVLKLGLNRDIDANNNETEQFLENFDKKPLEAPIVLNTQTMNNTQESASTEEVSTINTREENDQTTAIVDDNIEANNVEDINDGLIDDAGEANKADSLNDALTETTS